MNKNQISIVDISPLQSWQMINSLIELDDGKIYWKPLYLMVKTHGFPVDFPLNQSIDSHVFNHGSSLQPT